MSNDIESLPVAAAMDGDAVVVTVSGEIDISTAGMIGEAVTNVDGSTNVRVDLSQVTFMDSSGLNALLATSRRLAERGSSLVVIAASGPVERLLEVSGVHDLLCP